MCIIYYKWRSIHYANSIWNILKILVSILYSIQFTLYLQLVLIFPVLCHFPELHLTSIQWPSFFRIWPFWYTTPSKVHAENNLKNVVSIDTIHDWYINEIYLKFLPNYNKILFKINLYQPYGGIEGVAVVLARAGDWAKQPSTC